jgi:hypothetical protein
MPMDTTTTTTTTTSTSSNTSSTSNTNFISNTNNTSNTNINPPVTKKRLPLPPVNGPQILNEFNLGGKFSNPVPLPDLVSILVEIWENEEL